MIDLTELRWADAAQSSVKGTDKEGREVTIPVSEDNLDWRLITQSGATISPFQEQVINPLALPLVRLDFWLAAASAGVSKWSVRERIAAMPEGLERLEAIAWFEEAKRYRRDDPLLIAMAEAEGITSTQLDALWAWAVNP